MRSRVGLVFCEFDVTSPAQPHALKLGETTLWRKTRCFRCIGRALAARRGRRSCAKVDFGEPTSRCRGPPGRCLVLKTAFLDVSRRAASLARFWWLAVAEKVLFRCPTQTVMRECAHTPNEGKRSGNVTARPRCVDWRYFWRAMAVEIGQKSV